MVGYTQKKSDHPIRILARGRVELETRLFFFDRDRLID